MFNIYFNGLNSLDNLGLVIEHRPYIPVGKKKINETVIPGRNGKLTEEEGTFEDIIISMNFGFLDRKTFLDKARMIKAWINGEKLDYKLIFSDDTNYYYKVKYVSSENIERDLIHLGRFTLEFVCEPFAYEATENTMEITQATTIYNNGYSSEPYLKIYASEDITLTINNSSITLNDIAEYVEIDTEMMNCYKGTQALNYKMSGEFPVFVPGENNISWSGSVSKIEINPRWRWL